MRTLIILIIMIECFGLSFGQAIKVTKKDLKALFHTMTGKFNSGEQAMKDTSFIDISLVMVPIRKKSSDGYWLYVEQAMSKAPDKPYRQRVYHLYIQDDSTIVSKVFEIENIKSYTGAYNDKSKLKSLKNEKLIDRQGCSIFLHKDKEGNFSGSTPGRECLSSLRGAKYATSQVMIFKDKLISWDRGWDQDDHQVWGAKKGGYIFLKSK